MPAVWWSPTRRSGPGVPSSGRTTLPSYGGGDPAPAAKWHFDEVFVTINGTTDYLWRAVDQHGNVLDILVQSRRNAVGHFRPGSAGQRPPRVSMAMAISASGLWNP